jgi:hypothetical protein
MATAEYPALFAASDRAALAAQVAYLRFLRAQLVLLVVASIAAITASGIRAPHISQWLSSAFALTPALISRGLFIASALSVASGLIVMLILRVQRYEKIWFDCRAVAESVKSATWRYMMQAPPYHDDGGSANVDMEFLRDLAEIRKARAGVNTYLVGLEPGAAAISPRMREIRALELEERKKIYLSDRLLDQQTWYENKAQASRSAGTRWFWSIIAVQVFALAAAIAVADDHLADRPYSMNLVPFFMSLAGACLAWTQANRHEELTQSYASAAHDLEALKAFDPYVSDAQRFREFVSQVEDAISREHSLWRVRRNVSLEAGKS